MPGPRARSLFAETNVHIIHFCVPRESEAKGGASSWARPSAEKLKEAAKNEISSDILHPRPRPLDRPAAVETNTLVWSQGFGFTDRDRKIAVTPDTLFSLQSMSKTFTTTAILMAGRRALQIFQPGNRPGRIYPPDSSQTAVRRRHEKPGAGTSGHDPQFV